MFEQSGLSGPTKHVLFGAVSSEQASYVIVRRLRAAIGLGLLADGVRLPREADLAKQLDVTAFALREALGLLRDEGLIVTRAGKNGGSFVCAAPDSDSIAMEDLVRISATNLRDLSDWRLMLTAHAAWLAAQRAPASLAVRLDECSARLRAAHSPQMARRALGQFHIELSAGAQSIRLSRADLQLHEEFGWLTTVLLGDQQHRDALANAIRVVSNAIRGHDAEAARSAAGVVDTYLVTELVRQRLRLIALQHRHDAMPNTATDLLEAVRVFTSDILALLGDIAEELLSTLADRPTLSGVDSQVARSVLTRTVDIDPTVHGIGYMAEPGTVCEQQYWIDWWRRTADGGFDRDRSHVMDPARDDFYDYASKEYMTAPRALNLPAAMGPYIDFGGADDYLLTIAVPVDSSHGFAGIAAVDILIADLERSMSPWLARYDGTAMLLNRESRVILSNALSHNVGDRVAETGPYELIEVGVFGWILARSTKAGGDPS